MLDSFKLYLLWESIFTKSAPKADSVCKLKCLSMRRTRQDGERLNIWDHSKPGKKIGSGQENPIRKG